MSKRIWLLALAFFAAGPLSCNVGCAPSAMPREFEAIAKAVATSITDQASWQSVVGSVNGQVIEPGVAVEAGLKYFATARLVGVSGQVGLSASGGGTGVASPEALAAIRATLTERGIPEAVVDEILKAVAKANP